MAKFEAVADKVNLYEEVRDFFKREPDKEQTYPLPSGVVSIREWKEGVILRRSAEFVPEKGIYVLTDTVVIKPELKSLIERIRKKLGGVV